MTLTEGMVMVCMHAHMHARTHTCTHVHTHTHSLRAWYAQGSLVSMDKAFLTSSSALSLWLFSSRLYAYLQQQQ